MTTFHTKLLEQFQILFAGLNSGTQLLTDNNQLLTAANNTLTAIDANTSGGGSGTINALTLTEYYNGQQTVNIPQTIQLSLFVFRGNGTLIQSGGNIPLPRSLTLDYPFVSLNYLYPAIEFTLNTGNTEIFVQYQLPQP